MGNNPRGYVLRIAKGDTFTDDDEFVPVCTFTVVEYRCGLRAGENLRLIQEFIAPDGGHFSIGTVWKVLSGAVEDPGCLWLADPGGEEYSWYDNDRIFDTFERYET